MVRGVGEHRYNGVAASGKSSHLTWQAQVIIPTSVFPNIHVCVKFFTVSAVLLVQFVTITCSVAAAVLPEGLDALRSSLWPHLWHWHGAGTEERPVEWPLRQGGKEQRPMGYLYFTSILVFSSSILSSLLSTTEQTLSRNERPCNPSQCFTVLISDEHVPTLSISLTDF